MASAQGIDPVAAGRQHDADLQETVAALAGPNPHLGEMDLPAGFDGGRNMTPFVVAAPIVPDRGPGRPSTRAEIEIHRRRLQATRMRPYNRPGAAEIESQAGAFGRHWRDSGINSAQRAAAAAREAEVQREVAEQRRIDEFHAKRAAAHLEQERREFYRSETAAAARAAAAAAGGGGGPAVSRRASNPGPWRQTHCTGCGALKNLCWCSQRIIR
jgi:hypothetical protein